MTFTPRTVTHDGVSLACRDHGRQGGTGTDLVLMHGAGMTQGSLDAVIEALGDGFHVISFDFRGHGATTNGPWTIDTAVGDLAAVIDSYSLVSPAVGGHSLGGMVAAVYASRHPDCGPAINIDGHGMGSPSQYVGQDPAAAARWITRAQKRSDRAMTVLRLVRPLLGDRLAHPDALRGVTQEVEKLDLLQIYRDVPGALQVFNAYAAPTGFAAKMMKGSDGMYDAYRNGLRRDLTALVESDPLKELVEINATHMLIRSHPTETAALMSAFLRKQVLRIDRNQSLQ